MGDNFETPIEVVDGNYGSFAFRVKAGRPQWTCYESSDYRYTAVTDDYGYLTQVDQARNLRGY